MFTRCPHCRTVFRVTPQQLQASSGQVRCGRCQGVFDAFATLSARFPVASSAGPGARGQQAVQTSSPAPAAPQARMYGAEDDAPRTPEAAPMSEASPVPEAIPVPEATPLPEAAAVPESPSVPETTPAPPARAGAAAPHAEAQHAHTEEPDFATVAESTFTLPEAVHEAGAAVHPVEEARQRIVPAEEPVDDVTLEQDAAHREDVAPRQPAATPTDRLRGIDQTLHLREDVMSGPDAPAGSRRSRWVAANAGLLALALLQVVWVFATPIALALPASRPALEAFCSVLGCAVALPQLADELSIEASDLQMVNPVRPNEVLLTATIRNRANVAQQLPLLELTLIAGANQTAARKVFRPDEYLQGRTGPDRGIGSNQEVEIRLYLNTGNILPSGYRLFLFFA